MHQNYNDKKKHRKHKGICKLILYETENIPICEIFLCASIYNRQICP